MDLEAAIRDGRFREDLFYRLNVTAVYLYVLQGGDDRPPIIVSDGSINVVADYDTHGKGRGQWNQATASRWQHEHVSSPTIRFDVLVLDGSGGPGCDDANTFFKTTDLTITYAPNDAKFRIWVDPALQPGQKKLVVDFPDATQVRQYKPYWLKLDDATVQLTSVSMVLATGGTTTCQLGVDGEVHIFQRRK